MAFVLRLIGVTQKYVAAIQVGGDVEVCTQPGHAIQYDDVVSARTAARRAHLANDVVVEEY